MNLKQLIKDPKLAALVIAIIGPILGYLGYAPIQEMKSPSVDIDVHVPESTESPQKDWQPLIDNKMKEHIQADH